MPLWTAAMDPYVLEIRPKGTGPPLDLARLPHRAMRVAGRQHLLFDLPAGTLQLDIVGGAIRMRPRSIMPAIDLGRELRPQFQSIWRLALMLRGLEEPVRDGQRLRRLVEALRVSDALAVGASQREIGLGIYGDDWPGDGEHLKSRVRRMIILAGRLVRTGPHGVLRETI